MEYEAVIFDKDGVLVDSPEEGSMEWLFRARVDAAQSLGLDGFGMEEALKLVNAESNKEIEDFMEQEA